MKLQPLEINTKHRQTNNTDINLWLFIKLSNKKNWVLKILISKKYIKKKLTVIINNNLLYGVIFKFISLRKPIKKKGEIIVKTFKRKKFFSKKNKENKIKLKKIKIPPILGTGFTWNAWGLLNSLSTVLYKKKLLKFFIIKKFENKIIKRKKKINLSECILIKRIDYYKQNGY